MGTRGRVVAAGHAIAGVGIAAWAVFTAVVWPLTHDAAPSAGPWPIGDGDIDTVDSFRAMHGDLRWASMLLGFGGLLLLAQARGRQRGLLVGTAVWAVATLAFEVVSVRGWVAAGAAAVVTAAGFLVLVRPRPKVEEPPAARVLAVYSGGALTAAAVLFLNSKVASPLPGWADPAGLATVLLLVVTGVVNLVVAGARPRVAGVVGLVTVVVLVAGYIGPSNETELGRVVVAMSLAAPLAVPLACAGSLRQLPRGWAGVAAAVVLAIVAVPVVVISVFVTDGPMLLLNDRYGGYHGGLGFALAGAVAGAGLTRLALLTGAYAKRRAAPLIH